jgi:hypothetical protein
MKAHSLLQRPRFSIAGTPGNSLKNEGLLALVESYK